MDMSQVLQRYRDIDDEFEVEGRGYMAQTFALGAGHSFYFILGFDDNSRTLAIGDTHATFKGAFENGTRVDLTEGYKPNDAYDRTILIARALHNGVSLDEAVSMTAGKPTYEALDRKLGEPPGPNSAFGGVAPAPRAF